MRAWGVIFCFTAAGAVRLAKIDTVLAFYLVAIVSTAAAIAVARDLADKREQRKLDNDKATKDDVAYFKSVASMDDVAEIEWAAMVNDTSPRPLGARPQFVDPDRLHRIKIGPQRTAGAES